MSVVSEKKSIQKIFLVCGGCMVVVLRIEEMVIPVVAAMIRIGNVSNIDRTVHIRIGKTTTWIDQAFHMEFILFKSYKIYFVTLIFAESFYFG
jgi:hypothetical protein